MTRPSVISDLLIFRTKGLFELQRILFSDAEDEKLTFLGHEQVIRVLMPSHSHFAESRQEVLALLRPLVCKSLIEYIKTGELVCLNQPRERRAVR